ncbi:MAG: hypothetical protein U9P36_12735 [Thermodesulfobacteriota bacterium]|nr:hypothetical protein [Thermodesulfobacteriota bacterium]
MIFSNYFGGGVGAIHGKDFLAKQQWHRPPNPAARALTSGLAGVLDKAEHSH